MLKCKNLMMNSINILSAHDNTSQMKKKKKNTQIFTDVTYRLAELFEMF